MIWVIDDFYPNPDEVREKALQLEYTSGISKDKKQLGRVFHPGHRKLTSNSPDPFWIKNNIYLRNRWSQIAQAKVLKWTSINSNCAFNLGYIDKVNRFSWIHSDDPLEDPTHYRMYACVVYLTPNPPPNTGTLMFASKGNIRDVQMKGGQKSKFYPPIRGSYLDNPVSVDRDWTVHMSVANRYNRCIMYEADMLHAPEDAGFGETKQTARLTQIGFWHGEQR